MRIVRDCSEDLAEEEPAEFECCKCKMRSEDEDEDDLVPCDNCGKYVCLD